ncbi:TetR/AcrR family transcriptional regulator [Actinomadura sp. ATCC 31491]|uniref:TetR/AcrR family transcriptional regulator n=1 Tax=Actinomadura luzonensis TaxID=2805427 RepID=A0ABT0FP62_9ACTN|nr:TetR/AcrR family transcriptional regulator [Actinomadura luzonensis]MCK2214115.1 TetR/AcrR family transcriptional regulator [Actinomadura luzonensis]
MTDEEPRAPRADAQRNRARILEVARTVVAEQGTQASLRDVARRAGIGLGTLYRHFPTRDELLETLLSDRFDRLAARAAALESTRPPADALAQWVSDFAEGATAYRGLAASMLATIEDETSSLHASCLAMRQAAGRLLGNAQAAGAVRADVDGTDLFALVNAVGWIADQAPSLSARRAHLLSLVLDGLKPH